MSFIGLVAGLGNPGPEYAQTRHNLGFLAVDALLSRASSDPRYRVTPENASKDAEAYRLSGPGLSGTLFLIKPQTYMNLSGKAVAYFLRFFKLPMESLLVVHDDMDFPLGRMQLRKGGGIAGHNGLKSILEHVGTPDFARLRLGIGRPSGGREVKSYVLDPFAPQEKESLEATSKAAAETILAFYVSGFTSAQTMVNRKDFAVLPKP